VTVEQTDTSRDPRVAILTTLEDLLPAARVAELAPYLNDYDAVVRAGAVNVWTKAGGGAAMPPANPRHRYPFQPTAGELSSLPRRAVITMAGGGRMEIELHTAQAPVTIARFARLARARHYDGLTFHRVVPNFVVQGGSPGANEYVGTDRYMRDETGPESHVRGAVGISTRGRDTGDAQIFIDLVDVPRLDHDYTVFGRVVVGLDVLDRILEGARIERVTLSDK
jgi:cyclophilin family peptidyl-prolyl cis-trans isomerase